MSDPSLSTCLSCGHSGGRHDPGCPDDDRSIEPQERQRRRTAYNAGWNDGRNRLDPRATLHLAAYELGYLRGGEAADEAENGEPRR